MKVKNLDDRFGLLANGSCENWEVSVDEFLTRDEWIVELEGPQVCLNFQLKASTLSRK